MNLTKGQIMMIQNMVNTELSNKNTVYNPTELVNLKEQLNLYNVVRQSEQLVCYLYDDLGCAISGENNENCKTCKYLMKAN